jgi:hypothetical protein
MKANLAPHPLRWRQWRKRRLGFGNMVTRKTMTLNTRWLRITTLIRAI